MENTKVLLRFIRPETDILSFLPDITAQSKSYGQTQSQGGGEKSPGVHNTINSGDSCTLCDYTKNQRIFTSMLKILCQKNQKRTNKEMQ